MGYSIHIVRQTADGSDDVDIWTINDNGRVRVEPV